MALPNDKDLESSASVSIEMDFNNNNMQENDEEDWEEWDGRSPFWIHCAAGSVAGVVEHMAVYPLDTVRTHIQVCASCVHRMANKPKAATTTTTTSAVHTAASALRGGKVVHHPNMLPTGMWQTMRFLMNEPMALSAANVAHSASSSPLHATPTAHAAARKAYADLVGITRLWRGAQTMLMGCIPAHALYFSAYETVKHATMTPDGHVTAWGSSLAGAAAVCGHDLIMTPLDTMKQRLQLGHYTNSTFRALSEIMTKEGTAALWRSFPITLATNVPYGMVMVTTHETCKQWLGHQQQHVQLANWQIVFLASSMGGFTAAALTTPLDRIKTALQTQTLQPACLVNPAEVCKKTGRALTTTASAKQATVVLHDNWQHAAKYIWQTEGWRGFCRGLLPRVLSHTPAVAISWTSYEMTKQALLQRYHLQNV